VGFPAAVGHVGCWINYTNYTLEFVTAILHFRDISMSLAMRLESRCGNASDTGGTDGHGTGIEQPHAALYSENLLRASGERES